jgi:hypothetical protein
MRHFTVPCEIVWFLFITCQMKPANYGFLIIVTFLYDTAVETTASCY